MHFDFEEYWNVHGLKYESEVMSSTLKEVALRAV